MTPDGPAGLSRFRPALWWLLLCALCLAIHWLDFRAWFRADDFAWLGLSGGVHSAHDLLLALFQPRAQGTIRPWSERAFFILGYTLFGLNALPYRILIFATEFADLALVAWIGSRLTGSRAAGFCAAVLWILNSSGMEPLGWACVYNQVLCAFFLLLAFYFLLRYVDTGERRFYVCQWVAFLLGFGALEANVVYPALAAAYTLLCARRYFRSTLPMFAVSAAYAVIHRIAAPIPKTGEYAMHFTGSMLHTLGVLWTWAVGPTFHATPFRIPAWVVPAEVAVVSLALLWFLVLRRRNGPALFCLLWFLIAITPVLPLRDHITEYYVYIPLVGLCWLGGWGFAIAWRSGIVPRIAVLAIALLYAALQVPQLVASEEWNYHLTLRAKNLVEGVAGARERHPSQAIVLYGMDGPLFWNAVRDHPFRLLGIDQVYLAPGTAQHQEDSPEWTGVEEFVLPGEVAGKALGRNELAVYDIRGPVLRNITSRYAELPRDDKLPLRLDVGNPLAAHLLGPEWYDIEAGHRWMPRRASLKLGGPTAPGQHLFLHFNCGDQSFAGGPFFLTVTVDRSTLPVFRMQPGQNTFEPVFALPPGLVGKSEVQILMEVNRTFRAPPDARDLGIAFGVIEIR